MRNILGCWILVPFCILIILLFGVIAEVLEILWGLLNSILRVASTLSCVVVLFGCWCRHVPPPFPAFHDGPICRTTRRDSLRGILPTSRQKKRGVSQAERNTEIQTIVFRVGGGGGGIFLFIWKGWKTDFLPDRVCLTYLSYMDLVFSTDHPRREAVISTRYWT